MAELTSLKDPQIEANPTPRGVSVRAVVFGICITTLVNLLPAYSAYIVQSSRMVFAHIPMAVMVVFTLGAWPLNIVLGAFKPAWAFHRGEMAVVFCMGW
ncbi:MAG: hypothetical protein O7G87_04925, partial [bacterium]|nr:hypothetical protein [bacterium]